jgi:uncharacterized coiled-coil DUF342 family protein
MAATSSIQYDQEVLDMAQAAANVRNERDTLRKEVEILKAESAILNARLGERQDQINRLENQLLIATMRNGQQVSIIEQIQRLTGSYEDSVHAAGNNAAREQRQELTGAPQMPARDLRVVRETAIANAAREAAGG